MMDRLMNILIFCLTLIVLISVIECRKLKLVIVVSLLLITNCFDLNHNRQVHRHGDRTPVFTYPTDPYGDFDKYWPDGLGHLTTVHDTII